MNSQARNYPTLPPLPLGVHAAEADIVCVGAQRCGTTRLAVLLGAHPEFHYPDYLKATLKPTNQFISVKERHYFERTHLGLPEPVAAEYKGWFPRPQGKRTGEFTPRYMYDFWALRQLHRSAPNTKILVMLRDPVERFWSGCQFAGSIEPSTFNEHFQRGLYADQLERLYRYYKRESVLIVQYEAFNATPDEGFAEVCRFIGIDDTFRPSGEQLEAVVNAGQKRLAFPDEVRQTLIEAYEDDFKRLLALEPRIDRSLWKNFG